jgi:Lar family restriction alleviation protein
MKLKPCPFCGGTRIKTRRLSEMLDCAPYPHDFFKECQSCHACGPFAVRPTSAGAFWNERIADAEPSSSGRAVHPSVGSPGTAS